MSKLDEKLAQLKHKLESAAFLVIKDGTAKEVHSEIVQCLVIVAELESACLTLNSSPALNDAGAQQEDRNHASKESEKIRNEINKVSRKLKRWAGKQKQLNSRILNAYLKLERAGKSAITESDLKNEVSDIETFESNFVQMKTIASNNHAKVFDKYGDEVRLWAPIVTKIREYEKVIFGDNKAQLKTF